jgi:EAL domain-containing protein (putative c-di-GMP-specific phosphodiesterase class I)
VQQLVKLKGSGGTRRFEVLVRDAHADNEFGVAPGARRAGRARPERELRSRPHRGRTAVAWMARTAASGKPTRQLLGERRHGHDRGSEIRELRAPALKNHKVPAKALGFEITRSPASSRCATSTCSSRPARRLGCHVVLDDFTLHHNAMRWLGSPALKFLKLDPKITAVAMKDACRRRWSWRSTQASKVLGLSCVAKRVDTPACATGCRPSASTTRRASCSISRSALIALRAKPPSNHDEPSPRRARRLWARRLPYLCGWPASIPCEQPRCAVLDAAVGGWRRTLSQYLGSLSTTTTDDGLSVRHPDRGVSGFLLSLGCATSTAAVAQSPRMMIGAPALRSATCSR